MTSDLWPSVPGTYLLFMQAADAMTIAVGAMGTRTFPEGVYVYAGSAMGSGGLSARIERHLRAGKLCHWHIDYVTAILPVVAVAVFAGRERRECELVQTLLRLPGSGAPVAGFGSSDCRSACPAHLIRLPDLYVALARYGEALVEIRRAPPGALMASLL